MKFFRTFLFSIILFSISIIPVTASIYAPNIPKADIFKEGIYHFDQSTGKKITLKLTTLDKPMTIIVIDNANGTDKLKYYIRLEENSNAVNILLDNPLDKHTVIILGTGEIAFTFEN